MALGRLSFGRLRPVQIAALSVAYWIGVAAVKLGGLMVAIARVALPGMHGNVGAELKNLVLLHVSVSSGSGSVIWDGSTTLPALAAWIVGPPLILALTARWAREVDAGDEAGGASSVHGGETTRVLSPPAPEWEPGADRRAGVEAERRSRKPDGSG